MEDVQNIPRGFIESHTTAECISFGEGIYTQTNGHFDSQSPDVLLWDYFSPLYNQPAHGVFPDPQEQWGPGYWLLTTGPAVLSPWHNLEASVQISLAPDVSDGNIRHEFRKFADDQIWEFRPGRRIMDQNDCLRGTNSPFNQGNGNDVRPPNPNQSRTTSDSPSSHVSPQQSEYIPDTHPNSLSEHHPGQEFEDPESSRSQRIPEIEISQGPRSGPVNSKKWPCDRDGCDKRYGRRQEVKRHVREKHGILPKCLICGIKWSRAVDIREHLIKKHRGKFTEKEREEIRDLIGLNNTIQFLKKWESTRL